VAFRFLTALPVYNEVGHVTPVLDEVVRFSPEVLVVDDGSSDGTSALLRQRKDIRLVSHEKNRGYGAALRSAFDYMLEHRFDLLVTIDCDGQHSPKRIPEFVTAAEDADIVSGSRYLQEFPGDTPPPVERRRINEQITALVNERLGLHVTDAFCGFKAYRASALARLNVTEPGYAMPLQLWVQAARLKLRVVELPVPLIYLEEPRSFGGSLDDAKTRLAYYQQVIDRSLTELEAPSTSLRR
jgi:glycosyltransferase involved in cell wall biosynthesis